MFSGIGLGQEIQLRMHQNASQSILFSKIFWGSMPPDPPTKGHATHAPFLTRPPTSQLAPTPLLVGKEPVIESF